MIQVEINKDVRNYKEKLIGPFSGRECVCLGIGFGAYYLMKSIFFPNLDFADAVSGYLLIACMIPAVIIGWVKFYGMYLEVFLKSVLFTVLAPKIRRYDNSLSVKRKMIKTKKSKNKDLIRMR